MGSELAGASRGTLCLHLLTLSPELGACVALEEHRILFRGESQMLLSPGGAGIPYGLYLLGGRLPFYIPLAAGGPSPPTSSQRGLSLRAVIGMGITDHLAEVGLVLAALT